MKLKFLSICFILSFLNCFSLPDNKLCKTAEVNIKDREINLVDSDAPTTLPSLIEFNTSYKFILNQALKSLLNEHNTFKFFTDMPIAYSFFSLGNYNVFYNTTNSSETTLLLYIRKNIFSNSANRISFYNWAIPFYKKAFSKLSLPEQQLFLNEFIKAENYLLHFSYLAEVKDFKLQKKNFANTKGKLCAFLFRRINNKEINLKDCILMMNQIKKDFEPLVKNKDEFCSYVIAMDSIYNDVFCYQTNKGFGLVNSNTGKIISEGIYNEVVSLNNGYFTLKNAHIPLKVFSIVSYWFIFVYLVKIISYEIFY